jgi:hypothetical protein
MEDDCGQGISGKAAHAGRERRADREAGRKGPVDRVVLGGQARAQGAEPGEARREGRGRPPPPSSAGARRYDDRRDRGRTGPQQRHRSPLDAEVRVANEERPLADGCSPAVLQSGRAADGHDGVQTPWGDRVRPRGPRVLSMQAVSCRWCRSSSPPAKSDSRRGSRAGAACSVATIATAARSSSIMSIRVLSVSRSARTA